MNIFNRNKKKPSSPPAPAGHMNSEQFAIFKELVVKVFSEEGTEYDWKQGIVTTPTLGSVALYSLSKMCLQQPQSQWQGIIQQRYDALHATFKEKGYLDSIVEDFEQVKELIVTRVVPMDYASSNNKDVEFIYREDIPETITGLFFNLQNTILSVSNSYVEIWGKTKEELFELGLQNVRNNKTIERDQVEIANDLKLNAVVTRDFLAPSFGLLIDKEEGMNGKYGCLFTIPNADFIAYYPIQQKGAHVHTVLERLVAFNAREMQTNPKPLSALIYYYDKGVYTPISYTSQNGAFAIIAPEPLQDLFD